MNFRGCFSLFSKIRQIFAGSLLLMGKTKLDETYIFKISIKMRFNAFHFLEFWLLLSRVAPYYCSLPRTVWWETRKKALENQLNMFSLDPFATFFFENISIPSQIQTNVLCTVSYTEKWCWKYLNFQKMAYYLCVTEKIHKQVDWFSTLWN